MFLAFLIFSYVGPYLAMRKVVGDALSVYSAVCTTLILSSALCYAMIFLTELVTGRGTGFAGAFVIALTGLPLALLGLLALFIGGLVGWVHMGASTAPVDKGLLCSNCGHPASEHRMATAGAPQLACFVHGCTCALMFEGADNAP